MNILLDSSQNAKICDFGLAHQMCMESTTKSRGDRQREAFTAVFFWVVQNSLSQLQVNPHRPQARWRRWLSTLHGTGMLRRENRQVDCFLPWLPRDGFIDTPSVPYMPCRQMEVQSQEKVDIWAAGCILIVP